MHEVSSAATHFQSFLLTSDIAVYSIPYLVFSPTIVGSSLLSKLWVLVTLVKLFAHTCVHQQATDFGTGITWEANVKSYNAIASCPEPLDRSTAGSRTYN